MDNIRLIAIACGLIVMLVIIMLCCDRNPDTSGLKKPKKAESSQVDISIQTGKPVTEPPELDIFGRPVTTTFQTAETDMEVSTETTTVTFETDVFGNTITATTGDTDISGTEVGAVSTDTTTEAVVDENAEPVTDENGRIVTEPATEETTLSPIEQYEQDLKDPHSIGGFNHGQYDEDGNPVPTLPSDFTIVIN